VSGAERVKRERRGTLAWIAPLATLVGVLGFAAFWWRWGRAVIPKDAPLIGRYYRDLPDDPPAVVDAFMRWGEVNTSAFGATLLDLAQRRYFTIRELRVDRGVLPDRIDYEFTLAKHLWPSFVAAEIEPPVPAAAVASPGGTTTVLEQVAVEKADGDEEYDEDFADDVVGPVDPGVLRGFERVALDQLFTTGGVVRQSALARIWRADRELSAKRWNRFASSIDRSLRARGYLQPKRALPYVANVGLGVLVLLVGMAALAVGAWVGGVVAIAWAVVQLCLTRVLRQRTPRGELRYRQWRGVKNFLHDFSQLATAPTGHLVLWERYLVYSVALGVSDELAHALSIHVPDRDTFLSWYAIEGGGPGYGSFGHFSNHVSDDASGSFSPASESGTGGAFSGGGGGGGGGGCGGGGCIGAG
jgi:hypothetical protein